jgi:hypothetical protein
MFQHNGNIDISSGINTGARVENFITAFCLYRNVCFFNFGRSLCIMKVVYIGSDDASNYNDLKLQVSNKPSSHGKFYFFKDKIFLQMVKPITSYECGEMEVVLMAQQAMQS